MLLLHSGSFPSFLSGYLDGSQPIPQPRTAFLITSPLYHPARHSAPGSPGNFPEQPSCWLTGLQYPQKVPTALRFKTTVLKQSRVKTGVRRASRRNSGSPRRNYCLHKKVIRSEKAFVVFFANCNPHPLI